MSTDVIDANNFGTGISDGPALFGAPPVHVCLEVESNALGAIEARFFQPFHSGSQPFCQMVELPGELDVDQLLGLVPAELVALEWRGPGHGVVLIETSDYAVMIQRRRHVAGTATIRADSRQRVADAVAEVTAWFPRTDPPLDRIPIDFWQSSHGMYTTTRSIEAPAWDEVAGHYPGEVGSALDDLIATELDAPDGRVILWHGPPGTGKTSAIRLLAREWRDQARFQVVLDPEPVFSNASNLMEVVLDTDAEPEAAGRWRILVIEDADDIVRADNDRTSQSLSRLLNIGDGIVGQGLKVMVLLTTNESPDQLHPALLRPGRCMSLLEFRRFSTGEATRAFPEIDIDRSRTDVSLAEIMGGRRSEAEPASTGLYL